MRKLEGHKINHIWELRRNKVPYDAIAKTLNLSLGTVVKYCKQMKKIKLFEVKLTMNEEDLHWFEYGLDCNEKILYNTIRRCRKNKLIKVVKL